MKNLVNKIYFEEDEEVILPSCPQEVKGYELLTPEEQSFCSVLSSSEWEMFIADILQAQAMDEALAKALA